MKHHIIALLVSVAATMSASAQSVVTGPEGYLFSKLPELELPVGVEVLFGPDDHPEGRVIRAIDEAKFEVLVNHYLITNDEILAALGRAKTRKLMVMVLLDSAPAVADYQGFEKLKELGIPSVPIRRVSGRWNNCKYIIVDRTRVLLGSGDLTRSFGRNDEVLMVIEEPTVIAKFYNHFVGTAFPSLKAKHD